MERRRKFPLFRLVIIFITVLIGVILFLTIIRHPASPFISFEINYDESLTDSEKQSLQNYFSQNPPSANLTISALDSATFNKNSDHQILYSALLPVAGFYSPDSNVSQIDLKDAKVISDPSEISDNDTTIYLLPQDKLDYSVKLLSVDKNYYLDSVAAGDESISGAIFRVLNFESSDTNALAQITEKLQREFLNLPSKDNILKFIQTGVTALTRQMQTKLNSTGDASLFSAKIASLLSDADYTHTSNEVSFADDCNNNTPMAFCSDYRMFDVLKTTSIDIVELTGNHNNDWGATANISTIDFYHDHGIDTVGGGKNEEEAKTPLNISDKNTNITLIAINNSTSSKENGQGASENHPGANIYDQATTLSQIKDAKSRGDFVIVDIQFAECYSYPDDGEEMPSCDLPITGQEEFFKMLADAGADLIVGTQAHQPQTYELYNGKPIYYGLGNLFFDQYQWPGTMRSLVLTHYFKDGKLLQTKLTPTMYDRNFQTAPMDDSSAKKYLTRLTSYNN